MSKTKVLFVNVNQKTDLEAYASRFRTLLQDAYDAFNKLNLDYEITLPELLSITNPKRFVQELIYDASPAFNSLPIEKDAALAMIKLPAGISQFEAAQQGASGTKKHNLQMPSVSHYAIEGNQVVTLPSLIQHIAAQTEIRTITDKEVELVEELEALFLQIKDIKSRYPRLQIVASNLDTAIIDDYFGKVIFKPQNITALRK